MFNSNSIQPDVRPHEIAFVEASEKKRSRTRASEEELPAFLEPIIMGDDDDERSSFHSDVSEEEEVHSVCSLNSVEMYNGILYGDTPAAGMPNRGMGRHEDHDIDRVLRKHSSSYFLPDARCCFLLVLTIASLGISIFATDIARSNTEASFTTEFYRSTKHVQDTSYNHVQDIFHALESMSRLTTTFIKKQKVENDGMYPPGFVTIPNHEILLGNLRNKTHAVLVAYAPRIETRDQVMMWNQYYNEMHVTDESSSTSATSRSVPNQTGMMKNNSSHGMVESGLLSTVVSSVLPMEQIWKLKAYNDMDDPIVDDFWFCPSTYDDGTSAEEIKQVKQEIEKFINGTILTPLWTLAANEKIQFPHRDSLVNWNAFSDPAFRNAVQLVGKTGQTAFQDMRCTSPILWSKSNEDQHIVRNMVAVSPVFAEFPTGDGSTDGPDPRDVVGYILAIVPWSFVVSQDHDVVNPVHVVIDDECQNDDEKALFTLQVKGNDPTVLLSGSSDVNNEELIAMKTHAILPAVANPVMDGEAHLPCWISSQEGRPVYGTSQYGIIVYPTAEFQESYKTNAPFVYAAIVVATFLLVSVGFLAFNHVAEKSQKRILLTAKKQNVIVSSLFPKDVKKQLMATVALEEENLKGGGNKRNRNIDEISSNHSGHDHRDMELGESSYTGVSSCNSMTTSNRRTRPVADLFPETTIMFADIVGFTEWSNQREPSHVFLLLESIFADFDALAKRRRVYKVEVVGDCYVGVCGLPDPRKRHAVVMAKFALACLDKMDIITHRLKDELGPETANLRLRVGLHSGPVVAGVLRGDRSRFQLFGDSMNTASRMKSTGLPNRIQVSQETATRLESLGKGDWLKARSGRVLAKGKGELQTYFLSVSHEASSSDDDGLQDDNEGAQHTDKC